MEWRGRRQSDNIEDRRGQSSGRGLGRNPFGRSGIQLPMGGRRGGGLSFGTIIFLVVIYFVLKAMGIDMLQVLGDGNVGGSGSGYEQSVGQRPAGQSSDETTAFVRTVLAETETTWNAIFSASGEQYREPTLVLFGGSTSSPCGQASSATGPFYCPADSKVYLDTEFFDQLEQKFDAAGDFAQAYVIAHEVGHHVQNLTGVLPEFNRQRRSMGQREANQMSVRVELQADCYAGIWAKSADKEGILSDGDLEEALNAAQQIGDDTLQKRSQGYVVPDAFNHGTSAQRMKWFKRGYDSGNVSTCDTFSGAI
ncbi:neutral zinc metallopeptidase [Rhizobium sp. 'Codium 1']|uniref:KPN_02809 family neutral zinc metallopeptidase n=1 Tax=Rhizobium sp. 'Codium 1' TaxID=2940484 RepID=UPI001E4D559F|nr:neutral zinc metallopeptidase [Rhizobium sp. 'Codium 1']MCC8932045.1 zinc metallopeptidase [Rhizobium sp. 'Codium 1']